MYPFVRTREKNAVAQDKTGAAGNDDGRYLQRAMYPDDKNGSQSQSFCKKVILESAQHNAILKQLPDRADGKKESAYEHHERDLDIIHGYPGEHAERVFLLIYSERVALRDVLFRHVHILIAQDTPYKGFVMGSGKGGDDGKEREDEKGVKDLPVISSYHFRQLGLPEAEDTGCLFFFIPVDTQVYTGSQAIEVLGDFTVRVEGPGIAKIIHQFCELTGHFIRVGGRVILILFPLINIFFNEKSFSHVGRFSFIFTDKYSKLYSINIIFTILSRNMPLVKLNTGFNIEVEFAITPFHKRLFSWIIDFVVILSYSLLMRKLFLSIDEDREWIFVLAGLPPLFYHLICELAMNGQSIGKKALAIKVITLDGGQPSLSQYLIRWSFRLADFPIWLLGAIIYSELPGWCAIFLFAGIACVIATPYTQRIGDLVAGTIIIDTKTRTSWEDTVFTELESNYKPRFPQVMQLTDKDINTLKSIIGTVQKKNDYDLSMRIGERIKSKLHIESDQDSLDFLETLLKDYNYYATK